ncbi:MAG: hypothetical protein U9Q07_08520 [Planctomycetota bacterium]|nr:hypothetical protein [Planctomycetota bacterium]
MRLTEREIIQYLQNASDEYIPLKVASLERQVPLSGGTRADAIIQFSIPDGSCFKALAEMVSVASPKNILDRSRRLVDCLGEINDADMVPLIIAPFVGAKQAKILADKGISWIDLSGNMSIRVSGRIYIERTGKKNRFPDTSPIKKVFQGTSSLVSRALLLWPQGFSSLYEVVDFINGRNASITMSTVSKVLKSLEQELLITRSTSLISAIDREKLLEKLVEGYMISTERRRRKTYAFASESSERLFRDMYEISQVEYLACGFCAAQIKGLAVTDQTEIFVSDMEEVRKAARNNWIRITPDAEFGDLSITETNDPGVWFNASPRRPNSAAVIDDIELYLEMMADTPRGPKIAKVLKKRILEKLRDYHSPGGRRAHRRILYCSGTSNKHLCF